MWYLGTSVIYSIEPTIVPLCKYPDVSYSVVLLDPYFTISVSETCGI